MGRSLSHAPEGVGVSRRETRLGRPCLGQQAGIFPRLLKVCPSPGAECWGWAKALLD